MEEDGEEEAGGGSTAELQGGVRQKPPPAPSSSSSAITGNTQSGTSTTKSKLPSYNVSSFLSKSRGRSPRTSQVYNFLSF